MKSVVFAMLLVGCAAQAADDGFRAKLAAGCHSAEQCQALSDEGERRYKECTNRALEAGHVDLAECRPALQDRSNANRMRSDQDTAETKARQERTNANREHEYREHEQLRADLEKTGNACADIQQLEASAAGAQQPSIAEAYRANAKKRRERAILDLRLKIQSAKKTPELETADDPGAVRAQIAPVNDLVGQLQCFDVTAYDAAKTDADAWGSELEKSITSEEACRSKPACMGARAAKPICEAIAERKNFVEMMARESRNPSGFVDKVALHDLGQRIQGIDEDMPRMRAEYQRAAKKPFSPTVCPK